MYYTYLFILCTITHKFQVTAQNDERSQLSSICTTENVTCFCSQNPSAYKCKLIENTTFKEPILMKCLRYFVNDESLCPENHYRDICLNPINKENISVNELFFNDCPPPKISYNDTMKYLGIEKAKILKIIPNESNHFINADILLQLNETSVLDLSDMNSYFIKDVLLKIPDITEYKFTNNTLTILEGTIKSATELKFFNLSGNNIEYLKLGVFKNMLNLNILDLSKNKLVNLERTVFDDTPNLRKLIIDRNYLQYLTKDVFADLKNLTEINLNNNKFVDLPEGLFSDNDRLKDVKISGMKTLKNIPPKFFANLPNLENVDLSGCNILSIQNDLFWNAKVIKNINLDDNSISSIPDDVFKNGQELIRVKLTENNIESLPNNVFNNTKKLKEVYLAKNQLKNIQREVFSNLISVTTLDLSSNKIVSIHKDAFSRMKNLAYLYLKNNLIKSLQKEISFEPLPFLTVYKLQELDLSGNSITNMPFRNNTDKLYKNLKHLNLANNKLTELRIERIEEWPFSLKNNLKIDLSHNNISTIDFTVDQNYNISSEKFITVNLEGNPFNCDCHSYSSIMYLREQNPGDYIKKNIRINPNKLLCAIPQKLNNKPVTEVLSSELKCALKNITFSGKECECFELPHESKIEIDCSTKNIDYISYISDKVRAELDNHNHIKLNLSQNLIKHLSTDSYKTLQVMTELDLSFNNISEINTSKLSPKITVLKLDNNNLKNLDFESSQFLNNDQQLRLISLKNNPWQCDCQLKYFLGFIQVHFKKVDMLANVTCVGGKPISNLTVNDICPFPLIIVVISSVSIAIFGLIIGMFVALYYRFNEEIKVWLYAHQICLWFITEEELDRDKLYDAFVSFSHQDQDFVIKHIVPGLEDGPLNFKLCLHYRDWVVGDYIPTQITRSVENSRRTIVILSLSFLDSVWGKMEFRTAHKQALDEGRARVIVILYGDIGPTDELDPELKAYISMNTYIKWGDPWFWDRLRFALPHPPKPVKGIPLFQRNLVSQQNRQR